MNTLAVLPALLLMGYATATPLHNDILVISTSYYHDDLVIYTGKNEITRIVLPLNSLNFNKKTVFDNFDGYIFFVEETEGLYVLKNREATKLLENGKDIAYSIDENIKVFFAATDGLYTYNAEKKTAEKYGTLTDNIKNVAVTNGTDEIYILTEDHVLYKVLDDGTKKEEITNVKDAQQIVLDISNNLYFVDKNNGVYVRSYEDGTVKKIKGLPSNPGRLELAHPPAILDDVVPLLVGKKGYGINSKGFSEFAGVVIDNEPTAYSVEATLVVYLAHNKKIYQYSVLDILGVKNPSFPLIKSYLDHKAPNIQEEAKKKTLRL